jgi:hypothetical protein
MGAAASVDHVNYGGDVADDGMDAWPTAGWALLDELEATRRRLALIGAATRAEADALVERLRSDLDLPVVRLGLVLGGRLSPPSLEDVEAACRHATLITDLEVLMWHQTNIVPLRLLTSRASRHRTIAVWPGTITGGRATYSAPGRPDHHDIPLRDAIVLHPRGTRFPDEVPFTIERIFR